MACKSSNVIDCPCDNLENLFVNATYFVDSQFGNDSTAIYQDSSHPYQTLAAVLALVQPGEIVFVQPGTYTVPILNLNNATWYFSQGSTVTTNVTGTGYVYGYGNFIGQSPAITFTSNVGQLTFNAQSVTTPNGYAILISGAGFVDINVRYMESGLGVQIDGVVACEIDIDEFIGEGTFINATISSGGRLGVRSHQVQCGTLINSQSNSLSTSLTCQTVTNYDQYTFVISDPSANLRNFASYNVSISRLFCTGIINSSGIAGITDVLFQPNVNLNIQNINSRNLLPTPVIECSTSFVNLTYDTFAFSAVNPIQFLINVGDSCILHMTGARTYNADQNMPNIGFANITSSSFSAIRCNFTELFLTSTLIECGGNAEAQFDLRNFTNICPVSSSMIANRSQCIINAQKIFCAYADGSQLIQNTGLMQFNVGAWQCGTNSSQFITNEGRLQTKIGFFVTDGSGNTMISNSGQIMGVEMGSIRMDGSNNIALLARGPTIIGVGQIISNNSGNTGILVDDPGQVYGRVSRIIMQDMSCMEFRSSLDSNIVFDWMTNRTNSYVIYVDGRGEVTLNGNAITAVEVKYPVFVVANGSKFNLRLTRMDIGNCGAGIWIQAPNSEVNIDIQHFVILNDAGTAAVYAESGQLTLEGNYFMRTGSNSPLISLSGDVIFKSKLGFVSSDYRILESRTSGNVWYEASKTITRNFDNNINIDLVDPSQEFTVKGYFKTPGDYNVMVNSSAASFMRAIDCVMVSSSRNIVSPPINVISNYSIGNGGLSGGTAVPPGSFIQDGGVQ